MKINENYHLNGNDLTALFDKTFPAVGFADPVRGHIPNKEAHHAGCKRMRPVGAADTSLISMFMTSMSYPI